MAFLSSKWILLTLFFALMLVRGIESAVVRLTLIENTDTPLEIWDGECSADREFAWQTGVPDAALKIRSSDNRCTVIIMKAPTDPTCLGQWNAEKTDTEIQLATNLILNGNYSTSTIQTNQRLLITLADSAWVLSGSLTLSAVGQSARFAVQGGKLADATLNLASSSTSYPAEEFSLEITDTAISHGDASAKKKKEKLATAAPSGNLIVTSYPPETIRTKLIFTGCKFNAISSSEGYLFYSASDQHTADIMLDQCATSRRKFQVPSLVAVSTIYLTLVQSQIETSTNKIATRTFLDPRSSISLRDQSLLSSFGSDSFLFPENVPFTLSLESGSQISGYNMLTDSVKDILLAEKSRIQNCLLNMNSDSMLDIRSGSNYISFDHGDTSSPVPLSPERAINFDAPKIVFRPSTLLSLQGPPTPVGIKHYFAMTRSISLDADEPQCELKVAGTHLFLSDTKFTTSCSMSLLGGVKGDGYPSNVRSRAPNAVLTVNASSPYDSLTFDLSGFRSLATHVPPKAPSDSVALLTGKELIWKNLPRSGRINWVEPKVEPKYDAPYLLLTAEVNLASGEGRTANHEYIAGDKYNFTFQTKPEGEKVKIYFVRPSPPALFIPLFSPPPIVTCPPPPLGFICAPNGTWVSNGSVETPETESFVIPSVPIAVSGNLTVGGLTFQGNEHTLSIDGCLVLKPGSDGILIDLSRQTTARTGTVTLITQREGCPIALNQLNIAIKQPKGCEKVKSQVSPSSSRSNLTMLFVSDKSGCRTKWIILGAVLGGVVVLALVATLVTIFIVKSHSSGKRAITLKTMQT